MFTGLYARLIGIAVILAAVVGAYWYVTHLQSQVKTLTADNIVLQDKIKTQNAAVDTFKNEADARLTSAQAELAVAQNAATQIQTKSRIIYKTIPSKGTATCENDRASALDLLNAAGQTGTLDLLNGVTK
jgi:hypothetical protein